MTRRTLLQNTGLQAAEHGPDVNHGVTFTNAFVTSSLCLPNVFTKPCFPSDYFVHASAWDSG